MDETQNINQPLDPPNNIKARAAYLAAELDRHNYLYHTLDAPEIDDEKYDALFQELQVLENEWPSLKFPNSPTSRIGSQILANLPKMEHGAKMYGLDNVFSNSEFSDYAHRMAKLWQESNNQPFSDIFWCDPKLDGLALELVYSNNQLDYALTRGDGETGEVVTHAVRTIRNVPLILHGSEPFPDLLTVRGEVVLYKKDFEKLNERQAAKGLKIFANPRNAAAGSLRQLDISVAKNRPLKFLAYSIGPTQWGKCIPCCFQHELIKFFISLGFQVPPDGSICRGVTEVEKYMNQLREKRDKFLMEIDGGVAKLDDLSIQNFLGYTARAPRFAVAFKFPAKEANTLLENIEIQVGRTGVLTPVAILKPISVGGVTITHATLHNEDEIRALDIRIGDTVIVRRAGDVIPEVVGVNKSARPGHSKPFMFPRSCPACGQPVYREPEQAYWRCDNLGCPAIRLRSLEHFVSKSGLDIQGFGKKLLTRLLEKELIKSPADIFTLTENQLLGLERMGLLSAKKIIENISHTKTTATLDQLISALGILHIGESLARMLANQFNDLEELKKAKIEDLMALPDIGPAAAASIHDFFHTPANINIIDKFRKNGLWPVAKSGIKKTETPLKGKRILFTGTLSMPRSVAQKMAEEAGAVPVSSVGKNLDFLVAGNNPGSKLAKAEDLAIKILDEQKFLTLLKNNDEGNYEKE